MPRKVQIAEASDDDDNSSNATDVEEPVAPRRRRSGARKSLGNEASFIADLGRTPAKTVDINDDLAEKRRRRKSTKIPQDPSMAGPLDEADPTHAARAKKRLTIVQPLNIDVSKDVMNSNFDQWMKMHTDNKINVANSWGIFLIDYFHEGSLLRNQDDDSINFQRASATLEGCVKIWTSRVDSVGTDSAKLASNLASGRNLADEESGDEGVDGDPTQPKRKRNHRPTATLKEPSQLRSKKIETEFIVDPLFKKTCADFDEGGAQGLLMNHLSLGVGKDGGLRVVFDAGDSISKGDEDDDEDEPPEDIELSALRATFLPDLTLLDDLEICPELRDFAFANDGSLPEPLSMPQDLSNDGDDEEPIQDFTPIDVDRPEEDFFNGPDGLDDDEAPEDFGGGEFGDPFGGDDNGEDGGEDQREGSANVASNHNGEGSGAPAPFDPRNGTNDRTLLVTMDGQSGMDYFDNENSRNWAGPEHFKPRIGKLFRKLAEKDAAKPKVVRQKKEVVKIDFTTPADIDLDAIAKELFAKGKPGAITLPKKKNEKKSDHRLPDDMHFTSRQLVSLFLKPKFTLITRGRKGPVANGNEEVDENFWAQAAADQAAGREGDDGATQEENGFATQFFQDDFDDGPAFDDGFDGVVGLPEENEEDLLAATQNHTPRVRPPTVNYAKRAKRVDVKRLKDNIWKGLEIVVPHAKKEDGMDVDEVDLTDPSEPRELKSVLTNLQSAYPKEKMQDISTSFCFICLLHLANEQGLRLEDGEPDGKAEEEEERIGRLWDVKVYRDPDAAPAA